jgi:hypothetical protein
MVSDGDCGKTGSVGGRPRKFIAKIAMNHALHAVLLRKSGES